MSIKNVRVPVSPESDDFLKNETQFRLGDLMTESSHPLTKDLSYIAAKNLEAGVRTLNQVDFELPPVFMRLAYEGKLDEPINKVVEAILRGNKIFFTGCGATGRLSIQLDATWHLFWQELYIKHPKLKEKIHSVLPSDIENRVFSVMAGGDFALIKSVEGYEDQVTFGKKQINDLGLASGDVVFSVTEGGETSHVIGTAWAGLEKGADVFFVYNNPDHILVEKVIRSREVIQEPRITKINMTTGRQGINGSTRMQATSIETLILSSVLEVALYRLLSRALDETELKKIGFDKELSDIRRLAELSYDIPQIVRASIPQFTKLVALESEIYRKGGNFYAMDDPCPNQGYALYIAGKNSGLIILTDTTERSPTFYVPPFKPFDKPEMKSSPMYLVVDAKDNEGAWENILKRPMRGIEWDENVYKSLLGDEKFEKIKKDIPKIAKTNILKFMICGKEALKFRPIGKGNVVIGICMDDEINDLKKKNSFLMKTFAEAKKQGGKTALVVVTEKEIKKTDLPKTDVCVLVTGVKTSPLRTTQAIVTKILLNTLSTMIMVSLGRVRGNYMTYVSPSNKKLVDRASRILSGLTGIHYDIANHYIFEILKDTDPLRRAGKGLPAPVNIGVIMVILGVNTMKAIELLNKHDGLINPTLKAAGKQL